MTDGTRQQRRSDFRAGVSFPIWYRPLPGSDKTDSSWHTSMTSDLSAGGTLFRVDGELDLGSGRDGLLEVQLFIPKGPVFAIARLVRLADPGDGDRAVAIRFVSLAPGDREKIARVVLSSGLERRHAKPE